MTRFRILKWMLSFIYGQKCGQLAGRSSYNCHFGGLSYVVFYIFYLSLLFFISLRLIRFMKSSARTNNIPHDSVLSNFESRMQLA